MSCCQSSFPANTAYSFKIIVFADCGYHGGENLSKLLLFVKLSDMKRLTLACIRFQVKVRKTQ